MDHFEMVEKLRQKANVTYEEARDALENSQWDLLDALIYLESQGKIQSQQAQSYTTKREEQAAPPPEQDLRGTFTRFFSHIAELINKANQINLEVRKRDKLVLAVPLTVLILLLIFMFWWVLPALVIGLFAGFRYTFKGPGVAESINKAMDKAARTAEDLRSGNRRDDEG